LVVADATGSSRPKVTNCVFGSITDKLPLTRLLLCTDMGSRAIEGPSRIGAYVPDKRNGFDKPDAIERYFLRRRAINHRDMSTRRPYIQYLDALLETMLMFFGAPAMALASAALIIQLKWGPSRKEWLIQNTGAVLLGDSHC
jgi:hypothetical protein